MSQAHPVIIVPGITASYLRDLYPIPPETVWSVLRSDYERAALHPHDISEKIRDVKRAFEAQGPAQVVADQPFELAYKELVEELRFNLRPKEDLPVPVFAFGYDWRQPLEAIENELAAFIEEVIGRTRLLRHYHRAGYGDDPKVNLVGHSMGGLVIAGYLARFGKQRKVHKVVSLASPFQGSFEVVIKVTTGTANIGTSVPSSREREAARLTPALYYLAPSFGNGLETDPPDPRASLFNSDLWQPSIIDTIAEFIRLNGREPMAAGPRRALAQDIFSAMLKAAGTHRRRLDALDLGAAGLTDKDWLCVVGTNATTRVRLRVGRRGRHPEFDLRSGDRDNRWTETGDETARRFTGDGTVPFEGAIPKFLPYNRLVCVTPGDFGYWEIGDRVTLRVAGFHAILPKMNMVHRLIVRFLLDRPDSHGNTWGWPPPGAGETWDPPLALTNKAKDG